MDLLTAMAVFNRVARLKSFAAAAAEMGLSRTAVSRHVSDLEDSLDVRLLNRTTRRMSLTEAGAAYLARSASILADVEELQSATQNLHQTPRGLLCVTAPVVFGHSCLVPLVPRFLDAYPDLSLQLELTNRYVELIEEGYDLALRIGNLADSGLIRRKLSTTRVCLCATPAFVARHGAPATPDELASQGCIVYSGVRGGNRWTFLLAHGKAARETPRGNPGEVIVEVSGRLRVNSVQAAALAVRDGIGIGLLPGFMVEEDLAAGRLLSLLPDFEPKPDVIHAVYPHKHHLSAKVRVFIDYLGAELAA